MDKQQGPTVQHRELCSTLCGSPDGRGVWGRMCVHAKPLQSCLTLCDPMDCSPPGSSIHESGVLCPPPEDLPVPEIKPASFVSLHQQVGSLPLMPPEKPFFGEMNTCICMTESLCCPLETITTLLTAIPQYRIKSLKRGRGLKRMTIADLWLKLASGKQPLTSRMCWAEWPSFRCRPSCSPVTTMLGEFL